METKNNTNQASPKKAILISTILLALVILIGGGLFLWSRNGKNSDQKKVTIDVVIPDTETYTTVLTTKAATLGEALTEANLIEGTTGDYGLYITSVNGKTADESNQEWWCITKNGESVSTGADTTNISDGDKYELTLMIGW